jgi:hypothetical protein
MAIRELKRQLEAFRDQDVACESALRGQASIVVASRLECCRGRDVIFLLFL